MAIPFLLLLFVASGCVAPMKPASPETVSPALRKYGSLLESYISCTGNGKINSRGFFSGELTFKYMSQHDSSFLQFKDILGRKALLMWFTPHNVFAWNLIENKQYDYEQILEFFPFLYIVEPKDITKFLWGVQPNIAKPVSDNPSRDFMDLSLQFETGELDQIPFSLISATFKDLNMNQSVKIDIQKRMHHTTAVNLERVWGLIQS